TGLLRVAVEREHDARDGAGLHVTVLDGHRRPVAVLVVHEARHRICSHRGASPCMSRARHHDQYRADAMAIVSSVSVAPLGRWTVTSAITIGSAGCVPAAEMVTRDETPSPVTHSMRAPGGSASIRSPSWLGTRKCTFGGLLPASLSG